MKKIQPKEFGTSSNPRGKMRKRSLSKYPIVVIVIFVSTSLRSVVPKFWHASICRPSLFRAVLTIFKNPILGALGVMFAYGTLFSDFFFFFAQDLNQKIRCFFIHQPHYLAFPHYLREWLQRSDICRLYLHILYHYFSDRWICVLLLRNI